MTRRHDLKLERIEDEPARAIVYRLVGALAETEHCREVLEDVRESLKGDLERIVFSLAGLEFMTSAGVGIVASCYTSTRKAGGRFALVGVRHNVRRVLEICGLVPLVPVFESESEALADGDA